MFIKIQNIFFVLVVSTMLLVPTSSVGAYTIDEAIQYTCRNASGAIANACISNYETEGLSYTEISEFCVFKEGDNAGYDQCFRELGGPEALDQENSAGEDVGADSPLSGTREVTGREDINRDQCTNEVLEANDDCLILKYTVTAINVLSALAGMAIIGAMIFAGYLYMTARDNAGQIQQAKQRIIWALIALVVFVFTYVILDFLVPGGVI